MAIKINKRSLIIFLTATFLFNSSICFGEAYYVNFTNGNDSNDGLSPSLAWKTIAKVNKSHFEPGDYILFKRGQIWHEQLTVSSSGSPGSPITFGSYGTDENPIISGADVLINFQPVRLAYQKSGIKIEPNQVFYKGTRLKENDGAKIAVRKNEWDWDSDTLYINVGEDPSGGNVEISQRSMAVYNSQNYITFAGIHFTRSNSTIHANFVSSGNNVIIQNCEFSYATHHGIAYTGSGNNVLTLSDIHDNGSGGQTDSSGVFGYQDAANSGNENYISYNKIYNNYSFGIELLSNYYIIEHNKVYNNGNPNNMCVGIEIIDVTKSGYGQHHVIRYNLVYGTISGSDDGEGIYADEHSKFIDIYGNIIYGNDGPGIGVHRAQNITVFNNSLFGNCLNSSGELNYKAEIKVIDASDDESSKVAIKNNLVYATQANTYAILFDSNTYNMIGLVVDTNDWFSTSTNWYFWNKSGGSDLSVWNDFAGVGTDLNSDPLMIDPAKGIFLLMKTSPCRDAGKNVGLLQDYAGNSIFGTPDIGAYEYQVIINPKNLRIVEP